MKSFHAAAGLLFLGLWSCLMFPVPGQENKAPARILSLSTEASAILIRLGKGESIAAVDRFGRGVPGCENKPSFGSASALSRELLAESKIDFVFLWYYQDDAAALLDSLKIPYKKLPQPRLLSHEENLLSIGKLMNAEAEARKAASEFRQQMDLLKKQASSSAVRPKVYLELYSPFKTTGGDSYVNDLIELAGGINVARNTVKSPLISVEHLMENQPDVILYIESFAEKEEFARRPGFQNLNAVKKGRIRALPRKYLTAGVQPLEAVAFIRKTILEN